MHHLCYLCLVFFMLSRLFIAALWSPAGKGLTSWLLFVMFNCVFVTSNVVLMVRYGTWLYRFLILAAFLTFIEIWAHHFDKESKIQSKQRKHPYSPHPKKFKEVHSVRKVMASTFLDSQEVSTIDYLEQGRTINVAYYAGVN